MSEIAEQALKEFESGNKYYYGHDNTQVDKKKAITHYLNSANLGYAKASFYLSELYENGDGVEANLEESLRWLLESAEAKHPQAQYNLAVHYYNENEIESAYKWFHQAYLNGDATAKKEMISILNDHPELIGNILMKNEELTAKIKKLEKKIKKLQNDD